MAIPESIKQKANKIRNEVYGKDVREALASGIEEAGDIADKANTKSNDAVEQVDNIQAQVNQLVVEGDSSVEAAQARVDAEGKSFPTLKARLDEKETQFSSQLAQKAPQEELDGVVEEVHDIGMSVTRHGAIGVGETDEASVLQDIINKAIPGSILVFRGIFTFSHVKITKPLVLDLRGSQLKNIDNYKLFEVLSDDVTIMLGDFDMSNATNTNSYAIYAENRKNITIVQNKIKNSYYGIYLLNCSNSRVIDNEGDSSRHWDITVLGTTDMWVQRNKVENGAYDGIKVAGLQNNGTVECENIFIQDNICKNNQRDGIDVAINGGKNIFVSDNILLDNYLKGIDFKALEHQNTGLAYNIMESVIKGNQIRLRDDAVVGSDGISVQGREVVPQRVKDIAITGNDIKLPSVNNNNPFGIVVSKVDYGEVFRNRVRGQAKGMNIGYSGKVKVYGNEVDVRSHAISNAYNDWLEVYRNTLISEIGSPINVLESTGTIKHYNNTYEFDRTSRYSINGYDQASEIIPYNNIVGFSATIPTGRGLIGDTVVSTDPTHGAEKWIATINSSSSVWKAVTTN